jgi:hypothetical protein
LSSFTERSLRSPPLLPALVAPVPLSAPAAEDADDVKDDDPDDADDDELAGTVVASANTMALTNSVFSIKPAKLTPSTVSRRLSS